MLFSAFLVAVTGTFDPIEAPIKMSTFINERSAEEGAQRHRVSMSHS
jgi:hypothetical protein